MTDAPDMEPAALNAALKEYNNSLECESKLGATARIIRAYLAALSAEPGVAVPVAWQLRQRYGDTWTDWSGITENIAKSYATESRNDIEIRPLYPETLSTEAEADRKRLDFLDQCSSRLNAYYGTTYGWKLILNHNVNRLMLGHLEVDLNDAVAHGVTSCRSAIDAEMKRIAAAPLTEDPHHG